MKEYSAYFSKCAWLGWFHLIMFSNISVTGTYRLDLLVREMFWELTPCFCSWKPGKVNRGHPKLKLSFFPEHCKILHPISRANTKGGKTTSPHNESTERCLFLDTVFEPWDSFPDEITVWKGAVQLSGHISTFWCVRRRYILMPQWLDPLPSSLLNSHWLGTAKLEVH